jgi:hypothetical protein
MTCAREECREDIIPCRWQEAMGSCWYPLCRRWTHASLRHACADHGGDAHPGED